MKSELPFTHLVELRLAELAARKGMTLISRRDAPVAAVSFVVDEGASVPLLIYADGRAGEVNAVMAASGSDAVQFIEGRARGAWFYLRDLAGAADNLSSDDLLAPMPNRPVDEAQQFAELLDLLDRHWLAMIQEVRRRAGAQA